MERYSLLPPKYQRDLDTVLFWPNGRLYFFKEGFYLACDPVNGAPLQAERKIADGWAGLNFDRIDAAFVGEHGRGYFFRGEEYAAYSVSDDKALGTAQPWKDHWPALRGSPDEKTLWELLSEDRSDVPPPGIRAKLSFFQDVETKPVDRLGFLNLAAEKGNRIGAIADPRFPDCGLEVGPTPYRTGEDIVNRIADAAKCLKTPVDEIWLFCHGGPRGIFSAYETYRGLYVRWALLAPEDQQLGARTVWDVPTENMATNVVIVFASCGAGFPVLGQDKEHRVPPDTYGPEVEDNLPRPGLAEDLLDILLNAGLQDAKVYGIGGTGGYLEFSSAHKSSHPGVPTGPSPS